MEKQDWSDIKYEPKSTYDKEFYFESKRPDTGGFNSYQDGEQILTDLFTKIDELFSDIVSKKTHLDVASAYGWSVKTMNQKGWNAQGFDFAHYAVEHKVAENVYQADALDPGTWQKFKDKEFGLITANEFFEHIPLTGARSTIREMSRVAEWGFFTISANYSPRWNFDEPGVVEGHLNCLDVTEWIKIFDDAGAKIDYDLMHKFNKFADGYNVGIDWKCRTIIVKFKQ